MTSARSIPGLLCAALVVYAITARGSGDVRDVRKTPREWGEELFHTYCASCHGADAKGHGPAAAALKTPPADLTLISKRHGGEFPTAWVVEFIDGERVVAPHGSREMPIWGRLFRAKDGSGKANAEIGALATYLETVQVK